MNKYRNCKTTIDNITFDSKAEARRYGELKLLERVGKISDLQMQKRYEIIGKSECGRALYYVADFVYLEDDKTVVEDVKSPTTLTAVYKLKRRMMIEKYGIKIKEIMQ